MDFLRNHAHLAGGDTRKTPKNTQFSKSRHTPRGQGSPPRNHPQTYLSLTNPLNPFQPKYPVGVFPPEIVKVPLTTMFLKSTKKILRLTPQKKVLRGIYFMNSS